MLGRRDDASPISYTEEPLGSLVRYIHHQAIVTSSTNHPAMTRSTFSAQIPFSGFYYSWHNDIIETEEDRIFQDYNEEETYEHLQEIFNAHVDWRGVNEKYARHYVDWLKEKTPLKSMEFEEMVSPREYNFMTDRIFVTISRSDLEMMLGKVTGGCLDKVIEDMFTSCSGFISHYPNDISKWPDIEEWDHNHVYAVVRAYLEKEYPKIEEKIVEDIYGDGCVGEMLYNSADFMGQAAINVAFLKSRLKEEKEEGYRGPYA